MRKIIKKNKKGGLMQMPYIIVVLFLIAIVGLLFYTLARGFTDEYEKMDMFNDSQAAQDANVIISESGKYATDEAVFFFFLGGIIALIIAAAKTNFSPTVIFIFILVLIMSILLAAGFTNIYQGFAATDVLSERAEELTLTNIVFSQYTPLFFAIIGAIVLIIMYGKSGADIVQ